MIREVPNHQLTAEEFSSAFADKLPKACLDLIDRKDFRYSVPAATQKDRIVAQVLRRTDDDTQKIGAESRQQDWERGWSESLGEYVDNQFATSALVPKFIRPNQVVRLRQQFIVPAACDFELNYLRVLQQWLFRAFFSEVRSIHEFGCGTGINLIALAEMFPHKLLFGSDFVPSSVELISAIATKTPAKLEGHLFDMRMPDENYTMDAGAGILTFGSIEQLASDFHPFLQFLLANKPAICVHIEPTVELYDEDNLVDYLAIRFHRKRGYTIGFLPHLQLLAKRNHIDLICARRLYFGSMMMEGYNVIAWRPH